MPALAKIALDVATIRSAGRLLHREGSRDDHGQFADLDIAALGQLIEAIVLFDEVIVPDIGHQLDVPELVAPFGAAVSYQPVHTDVVSNLAEESRQWMSRSKGLDVATLSRLIGVNPYSYTEDVAEGTSSSYTVLLASIGAHDKIFRERAGMDQRSPKGRPVPTHQPRRTTHNAAATDQARLCSAGSIASGTITNWGSTSTTSARTWRG